VPAVFGCGFHPVCRTGKMPVPPRTFKTNQAVVEIFGGNLRAAAITVRITISYDSA
jgi:hypothetical protein